VARSIWKKVVFWLSGTVLAALISIFVTNFYNSIVDEDVSLGCTSHDIYDGYIIESSTNFSALIRVKNLGSKPFVLELGDELNPPEIWLEAFHMDYPSDNDGIWQFESNATVVDFKGEPDENALVISPGRMGSIEIVQKLTAADYQLEAFNRLRLNFAGFLVPGGEVSCVVNLQPI